MIFYVTMKYYIDKNNVVWRILDNEAIIIHIKTSFYYSLNKTGTFIWNILANRKAGLHEIAKKIAFQYQKKEEEIIDDVRQVLKNLLKEKLIKQEK